MMFNDFLTSGHNFDKDEYELKSKFVLMNSMLGIGIIFISILTVFLFIDGKIFLTIANLIFLFIGLISIYFLRNSKNDYKRIIPIVPLTGILLVATALVEFPDEQVRIGWFFIIIIISFFLGGRKLGFVASFFSIAAMLFVEYFINTSLNSYTLFLASVIILLGTIFINLYEQREEITKGKLLDINQHLEEQIKKETQKRIAQYKKSNLRLQKSAEEIKKQKVVFEHLAHHDTLTNLPNRVLFRDRLEHSIVKAKRNNTKLAVLFMDLDHFKEINDSLGHQIGDDVLKVVADRLKNELRGSDSIARLGGDEFTILLEDVKQTFKIGDIAQKLIRSLKDPLLINSYELYITASIGISIYPSDGEDAETLLKCADAAMYSAKSDGRNIFQYYAKEMTEQAFERVMLETSMRHALDNDEFVIHYQPQVDSKNNNLIGLEALVRWEHPEMGLIYPDKFIPLAETTSVIIPLGEWILRTVAAQMTAWHNKGFDPIHISVNLSVKQLRHRSLLLLIEKILEETKFRSDWLELEITEGYTMQNPVQSIKLLQRIRNLGVKLAIDDFGTGYSSLSYLKQLPINKLKIDKSFIKDIPGSKEDEALVRAIISMAESMYLSVIAEGVETEAQREFLQNAGCCNIQGYLFAKPMSANKIDDIFNKKNIIERKDVNG
ncbi:MAG: hypothetical protein B5M52_06235 [Helicobacteraceae bacterium 4484_230]|nr:MAG: hypothetical protein B5M52_06235 [Helicobacteraceae bacterium 4484_230]